MSLIPRVRFRVCGSACAGAVPQFKRYLAPSAERDRSLPSLTSLITAVRSRATRATARGTCSHMTTPAATSSSLFDGKAGGPARFDEGRSGGAAASSSSGSKVSMNKRSTPNGVRVVKHLMPPKQGGGIDASQLARLRLEAELAEVRRCKLTHQLDPACRKHACVSTP